jgi:asparagine synthase (glutamine-hydrolysing)
MLVDNLLLKADKIGMSHSLEMRVPLLNRDFSVKLFNLPDELKIHQGTSKFIERQLLKPHFANDFIEQRKQGFEVPIGNWLRQQGKSLMTEYLSPKRLAHGVLNVETVNTLMQQHLDGKRDWGLPLFAIIVLNIWIEEFKVQCT